MKTIDFMAHLHVVIWIPMWWAHVIWIRPNVSCATRTAGANGAEWIKTCQGWVRINLE